MLRLYIESVLEGFSKDADTYTFLCSLAIISFILAPFITVIDLLITQIF